MNQIKIMYDMKRQNRNRLSGCVHDFSHQHILSYNMNQNSSIANNVYFNDAALPPLSRLFLEVSTPKHTILLLRIPCPRTNAIGPRRRDPKINAQPAFISCLAAIQSVANSSSYLETSCIKIETRNLARGSSFSDTLIFS